MKIERDFKIGDRVEVINDTLAGKVIELRFGSVTMRCDDGFHYTFDPKELVLQKEWNSMINIVPEVHEKNTEHRPSSKADAKNKPEDAEIDLHLHELVEMEDGLSNHDKLSLQLSAARQRLETAIEKKEKKIIFIHGRGDGVLKKELQYMLRNYPVEFHDASYARYGRGATEVIIFQNKK